VGVVNRTVVLIRPDEPYRDWMLAGEETAEAVDTIFEEMRRDGTAYMLPETEDAGAIAELLKEAWAAIFEHELVAWMEDEAAWPPERTFEMFLDWFTVEIASIVVDLCDWELATYQGEA